MAFTWRHSYQTPLFDTPDGMLGADQYAIAPKGKNKLEAYYLRTPDAAKRQAVAAFDLSRTNNAKDIEGKTLVNIVGTVIRDEFIDETGATFYETGSAAKQARMKTTPNEPPPSKVSVAREG